MKRTKETKTAVILWVTVMFATLVLGNSKWVYAAENDSIQDSDLQDSDLQDSDLQDSDLQDSDLQDSDLQDGNLQDASLLQLSVDGEDVLAYIECGESIDSVEAQIAQYPCEDVQVAGSKDISIHTIIMLDNSLSVTEQNRENIKDILRRYVETLPEQEVVSLATFGEDMQFLCKKSRDTEEILMLIDEIEFHDQDTYLTDYLYQMIEEIENDPMYTRFIVISDGVDNKTIGITKDELNDKLKETVRPIYTIGHIYKDNSTELKNMFALSRATGGKELLIEDYDDNLSIADAIHDFSAVYSCRMKVPQNIMDGANRHVLLKIYTQTGHVEVTGEAPMPFGRIEEETEPAPEPEPEPEPAPAPEPEPVPEPIPEPESVQDLEGAEAAGHDVSQHMGEKIIVSALIVVIVLSVCLFYHKKKKQKRPVLPQTQEVPLVQDTNEDETVMLEGRYLLVLRDRMNPERIFKYPLDNHVIVGRNIDMVQIAIDYSLTISGQHCEFYVKNNRFFVRDMNSANHTYLDGRQIGSEMEVMSGSIVRLGEVEFSVEIMPI